MSIQRDFALLFKDAGAAHHRAFASTDGEDAQWAEWYAEYLLPRFGQLFAEPIDAARLAADLRAVDEEHRAARSAAAWPEYYGDWFQRRYKL